MRLIQAYCEVEYVGRCRTLLSNEVRIITIKEDGSVRVDNDSGIRPLNYMKSSETIKFLEREGKKVLYAANKQEELFVTLNEVLWDVTKEFPEDKAEKIVEGTENLLQKDLLENISKYIPGTKGICREYETGKGPVDICCYDPTRNKIILVEVKRTAGSNAVYQVMKYKAGIQNMYEKHKNLGTTKLEAKQKGQHDTSGTTIPLSAFKEPEYYLAARHFTSSAKREALENNVRMITVEE